MRDYDFAEGLVVAQPGQAVVMSAGLGVLTYSVEVVERVTKTQIIIGAKRYNRRTGRAVGSSGSYYTDRIDAATPELLRRVELHRAERAAENLVHRLTKALRGSGAKALSAAAPEIHALLAKLEGE